MPEAEAAALVQRLREAGLISGSAGPDMTQVLHQFEPLLQGIAAAVKDEGLRAEIEPILAELEQKGWRLTEAVHRIWAGERDAEALTAGLDDARHRAGAPRAGTSGTVRMETRSWTRTHT